MRKLLTIIAMLVLSVTLLMAQDRFVTGSVISAEDEEPVAGATIIVPGTNIGTVTGVDGKFSLKVPEKTKTVLVSFVGMDNVEVAVRDKALRIILTPTSELLDDVVVVAYGTQRKTTLTGAIQEVKSDAIELRPTSSATSALEGTVSGVQINSTYGAPGSDPSIRIRGISTVNGSSSPLYVLDGVPFGGNISDLNPADIESMSVLKDAASAALYGNRASNGVILITTKKGKQGRLNVSLDIKQGTYSRGIREYQLTNPTEWMETEFQNLRNHRMYSNEEDVATATEYARKKVIEEIAYLNIFNKADDALFDANGKMVSDASILPGYLDDLDWEDQATRNGYRQEYVLSANGANEKCDYLMSVGYLSENGYLHNSAFDRISGRAVLNISPKKWFKAGINMSGTHQNHTNTNGDSSDSYTNVFMYTRNIAPIYPVHLHDVNTGEYLLDENGGKMYDPGFYTDSEGVIVDTRNQYVDRHVMWENELNSDKTVRNTFNAIAYAEFILPYGIHAKFTGNLNTRNNVNNEYNSAVIGDGKGSMGRAKRVEYRYKTYTAQQMLFWNHDFGVHNVDMMVAHENYYNYYNYLYGYKTNEIVAGWGNFTNFTSITSLDSSDDTYTTESYLGRVRYSYDGKYNAEASFRRDGSSRFSKDARWGNFWSIGANWVISQEAFVKDLKWINFLKLRADYGEVGNDMGASLYGYQALYNVEQNSNVGALYLTQFPNQALKWETGQSWGIALEGRLFDRLNFIVEYFDKRNKDLLFNVYLPLSAGATTSSSAQSTVTQNLGTISNRGWELAADIDVFKNRDWKINIGANATFLKNKITKLPEQFRENGIIDGTKKIMEGKDRYAFWTYTWEGIDTYNGQSLYKFNDEDYYFTSDAGTFGNTEGSEIPANSINGNIVVIDGVPYSYVTNYAKREFNGSAIPTVYGSFNASVSWKGLSLSALFTYQLGGKVMDSVYASLMSAGSAPSSFHADVLNSWTIEDKTADHALNPNGIPVVNYDISTQNNTTSSRWLTKSDYLILKNLAVGYQLPKTLCQKIDLSGIGITVAVENLFTKTERQGMNPQQSFSGTQSNYLVTPRVFSVGLNVKF